MPDDLSAAAADQLTSHTVELLRFDAHLREQILGLLHMLETDLVQQLYSLDPGSPTLTDVRRERLTMLLNQTEATIQSAYEAMATADYRGLIGLAGVETKYTQNLLADLVGVEINTTAVSAGMLQTLVSDAIIMGAPSREWWERQAGDIAQKFADEMRLGILAGETNDQLVQRIRGTATGNRNQYEINGRTLTYVEFQGGLMDISTQHAMSLVRTSVMTVAGITRRNTYLANPDIVQGLVQISVLDGRTSPTCIAYAGKAWRFELGAQGKVEYVPLGHGLPYGNGVPRHWRCRSSEAPLLFGADLKAVGDQSSLSPEDWLDNMTPEQQAELLGKGRAELFREGRISLSDMLDMSGRPLTLADLIDKYGSVN